MSRRAVLAAALLAAACAAPRLPLERRDADAGAIAAAGARTLAVAGLRSWIVGGDRALAERRTGEALARDPREPWAQAAAALLAERRLDDGAEVRHLLALVDAAPAHALAGPALGRLRELARRSASLARAVEDGLGPVQPRLVAVPAARARFARASAATALGDRRAAASLRAEAAPVTTWTLVGPFGALHAFDFDVAYEPERGVLPPGIPGADGMPAIPSRAIPAPDGTVTFEGEPASGDVYYLATEVSAARGGRYQLTVRTSASVRVWLDGVPVLERRDLGRVAPTYTWAPVELTPGRHHLLVKAARGSARGAVTVALPRADGAPADLAFDSTPPATRRPPAGAGAAPWPERSGELFEQLAAESDPETATLFAAAEVQGWDRERAKALLADALRAAPASPPLLALRADVVGNDPTWSDRTARAAAEADLDRVVTSDPGDAAARLARAERMLEAGRADDASSLLEPLVALDPPRVRALVARARVARARNLPVLAERLADEARRIGGDCAALELLFNLPARRNAVALQDDDAEALARCPGGLEQVVEHRQRRGDLEGALAAADEVVRAGPARIESRLARADLLAALGRAGDAAAEVAGLAAIWPRDARIEKRRAELLEASGAAGPARAARERALLLDPADLALRRALALDRLQLPLDEFAEDGLEAIARYRAAAPRYTTSAATVLDFAAVEVHPGGAYTERVHTVVEARDQRAVDQVGEVAVPPGAELLRARTVKQDGRTLEAEEPIGDKRSLSLTGLEPGDFAEWEWIRTVPARGPSVPGFTADAFFFQADMPLWRSTYVVAAPAQVGLEVDAHRMDPAAPVREGERLVLRTTRRDVAPVLSEPGAPGDAEVLPFLQVGAGAPTEALARAIGDALLDAWRPTLEVQAAAAEIRASVHDGDPGDALVRAAYRRISERVLGTGGFDEPASVILTRGSGNRTIVLKAVLGALGVRARLALVRDFSRDPAPYRFPRPDAWAYALLRVEHAGQVTWLDPTARLAGYGVLPPLVRGADAMVVPEPGEPVIFTRVPVGDAEEERRRVTLYVAVDEDGGATITGREEYRGYAAASLRGVLEQLDAPSRRQVTEQALARSFRAPALEALAFEGEGDPDAPVVVRYRARAERWAGRADGRAVVDTALLPARLGARFLQLATRERPLLIPADERTSLRVAIRPPPGWSPIPTPGVALDGAQGGFQRTEHVEGTSLEREERFELRRGRIAPPAYPSFARWARAVDAEQRRPITFEVAAGDAVAPGGPASAASSPQR